MALWLGALWITTGRGGRPTARGVGDRIKTRAYLGWAHAGDHLNEHAHECLVDRLLWERANRARAPKPSQGTPTVMSGLVRCWSARARPLEAVKVTVSRDGRHVYVTSNVVVNTSHGGGYMGTAILAFRRRPDGALRQLAGRTGCVARRSIVPTAELHAHTQSRTRVQLPRS